MFGLYDKKAYQLLKKCSAKKDMTEWNEYREKTGNQKISLRFAYLGRFYLKNANLKNIDFRFARLNNANMLGADVENAKIDAFLNYLFLFLFSMAIYVLIYMVVFTVTQDDKIASIVASIVGSAVGVAVGVAGAVVGAVAVFTAVFAAVVDAVVAAVAVVDVAVGVVGAVVVVFVVVAAAADEIKINQTAFGKAKNPELAIGFDLKYKQEDISTEIGELEARAATIVDIAEKEELLKERVTLKEIQKNQNTIDKAIESLTEPYEYLTSAVQKLKYHNLFFYAVILLIGLLVAYISSEFISGREAYMTKLFADTKAVNFGSIVGVSFFYGSPIIFLVAVIIYSVSQINKNLDKINELYTQKHYIDVLKSAFNSKTRVGATDEEIKADIKKAADAIRDATIAKMLGKEAKDDSKEKETQKEEIYIDKIDAKTAISLFTAMLKQK